jgi:hypothetical protein
MTNHRRYRRGYRDAAAGKRPQIGLNLAYRAGYLDCQRGNPPRFPLEASGKHAFGVYVEEEIIETRAVRRIFRGIMP